MIYGLCNITRYNIVGLACEVSVVGVCQRSCWNL